MSGRLAGKSLWMQVVTLAMWPLLQQVMNFLVGFVDTGVAGRLSVSATNAIGVAAYFGWFQGLLFMAVGTAAGAVIARSIGAGKRSEAELALGQALLVSILVGLGVLAVLGASAGAIAVGAGLSGDAVEQCAVYLRVMAMAAPVGAVLFVGGACLSAEGDTKTPFFIMSAVNGLNLVLSVGLAMSPWATPGWLGGFVVPGAGWGSSGIAWGSAGAWAFGAVLTLAALVRGRAGLRLCAGCLTPERGMLRRIRRLAWPNVVERGGHWLGNAMVLLLVGELARRGLTAAQGAHIVAIRIEAICFLPAMGLMVAAGTLAGQYLGAGDASTARRAAKLCWLLGAAMGFTLGVVFILIPEALVRLLTDEPEILALSPQLVRICGYVQVLFASALVLGGAIRGAGDTRGPSWISNTLTWGLRLPGVAAVVLLTDWGLVAVWMVLCSELAVRGLVFAGYFLYGKWDRVAV
ncbi:MAG: MATE family efflux transporter [Planctomycetota bacterium]